MIMKNLLYTLTFALGSMATTAVFAQEPSQDCKNELSIAAELVKVKGLR